MVNLSELNETQQNILFSLSRRDMSPKQISDEINKTISYVSQQLKLLRLANYVKKKDVDQGKGSRKTEDIRNLYSLKKERVQLQKISTTKSFRKELDNTEELEYILNAYSTDIPNPGVLIKLYFVREDLLDIAENMYYLEYSDDIDLLAITEQVRPFRGEDNVISLSYEGEQHTIRFWSHPVEEFVKGLRNEESYFEETKDLMTPLLIKSKKKDEMIQDE